MHWTAGIHAVETALAGGAARVRRILVDRRRRDARLGRLIERARSAGITVEQADAADLEACVPGVRHQGVCAEVAETAPLDERGLAAHLADLDRPPFVLVLDGVQDPHNLGACLRSAEAAAVDVVVVPRDRAARVTAVVDRASAGAAGRVPLAVVTNLARTLDGLKEHGCWIIGLAGEAERTIHDTDLGGGLALVLGGEDKGLRPRTRTACDLLARIPLAGGVESLNVSVAAGICLFEALRQRRAATRS